MSTMTQTDIKMPAVDAVARLFATKLATELTADQLRQTVESNRTNGPDVCASHDHCDANMVMHEALQELLGVNPLDTASEYEISNHLDACGMSAAVSGLWNRAWNEAKRNEFYTGEAQ